MRKNPKRPQGLSKADRDLWDHVARSIDQMESDRFTGAGPGTIKVPPISAAKSTIMVPENGSAKPASPRRISAEDMAKAMADWPNSHLSERIDSPETTPSRRKNVPGLDKRSAERLRKGQMEIDGRLDLHGLTRNDAHRRLRNFITAAQIQGKRCVLVITGKGSAAQKTDDAPFMAPEKTGILREAVPKWLVAPDLRHLVIDIRTAQPKDGGSGALYVLLRRNRS
ncbi:MAG: Smr/MutS family protein [Sneathiella sp.]|nr:Smr/MutS family protein [Sneathiella sp.]